MWCKVYFVKDRKKNPSKYNGSLRDTILLIALDLIRKGVDVIANIKFASWSS